MVNQLRDVVEKMKQHYINKLKKLGEYKNDHLYKLTLTQLENEYRFATKHRKDGL